MSVQLRASAAALGSAALAALVGLGLINTAVLPPARSAPSAPSTDEHGFVDSSARCSTSQTLMAYGRTSRALVVVCVESDGTLQYRGVRLSDGAALQLTATRGSDGSIVASNDGVTYAVSSTVFLVSEGDSVLYRDTWTDFHQPRFSGGATSTPTPTSSTATAAPPATTTPTVSTTTVTMAPKPAA